MISCNASYGWTGASVSGFMMFTMSLSSALQTSLSWPSDLDRTILCKYWRLLNPQMSWSHAHLLRNEIHYIRFTRGQFNNFLRISCKFQFCAVLFTSVCKASIKNRISDISLSLDFQNQTFLIPLYLLKKSTNEFQAFKAPPPWFYFLVWCAFLIQKTFQSGQPVSGCIFEQGLQ